MQDIPALASSAGSALVGAAVTDGWPGVLDAFARLLGSGSPRREQLVRTRLDAMATEIIEAAPARREGVVRGHEQAWTVRLNDLLEERPEARDRLVALVREIGRARPGDATVTAIATGAVEQTTFGGTAVANTGVVTGGIDIGGQGR